MHTIVHPVNPAPLRPPLHLGHGPFLKTRWAVFLGAARACAVWRQDPLAGPLFPMAPTEAAVQPARPALPA